MPSDCTAYDVEKSFHLDDVTDDPGGVRIAFDIVTRGYSSLSTAIVDPAAVYATVCDDIYHGKGLARTLLLTGLFPGTSERNPLGTIRITLASTKNHLDVPPLEAMSLMQPSEGWRNFRFLGFDVDEVVEGGRVAICPVCRTSAARQLGLPGLVLRALTEGAYRIAAGRYGKTQYWCILPKYMIRKLEALGIQVIAAPQVSCRFEENAHLFRTYDRYWLNSDPRFCRVIVPPIDEVQESEDSGNCIVYSTESAALAHSSRAACI